MAPLHCRRTLSEVVGSGLVFVARPSFSRRDFLRRPVDEAARDFFAGNFITMMGELESLCAPPIVTPDARALLAFAGLPSDPRVLTYDDPGEYRAQLRRLGRAGSRLVLQHVHPLDEVPASAYWIDRALLSWLNNKANLPHLVPAGAAPERRLIRPSEIRALELESRQPLVLKAATFWSSGAGGGVVMVRSKADLALAAEHLAGSRYVVAERFLPFERTVCLTYAGNPEGIEYLGAPEQIVDSEGVYKGSWFDDTPVPSEAVEVGRQIMVRAVALGYRGIAGFDCGFLGDGRLAVFDLDFRLCSSTSGLLWFGAVQRRDPRGAAVGRSISLAGTGRLIHFGGVLRRAVEEGWFFPLGLYDPQVSGIPNPQARARGLVLGPTRAEAEARHSQLTSEFHSASANAAPV